MERDRLTHLDETGAAHMVDIGDKNATLRVASASGHVIMDKQTLDTILAGNAPKGDVLATARIAGIMAAKKTHDLIPLCHPLALSRVTIDIDANPALPGFVVTASVRTEGKTGVEMEAMTAVSIACLTIYDMSKALQKSMVISDIKLLAKSGGKSGDYSSVEV